MPRHIKACAIAFTAGWLSVSSCASPDSADSERGDDSADAVDPDALPWKWVDATFALQAKSANAISLGKAVEPEGDAKLVIDKLQTWVDLIDGALRDQPRFREQLALVPKPHIMLVSRANQDAFSATVPVCIDVPVVVKASASPGHRKAPGVRLIPDLNITASVGGLSGTEPGAFDPTDDVTSEDCVHVSVSDGEMHQFTDWVNDAFSSCQLTPTEVDGRMGVRMGAGCRLVFNSKFEGAKDVTHADTLVISGVSNWVTFTTGLLAATDNELDFVFFLSHELGHYYRAHLVAPSASYGYFFSDRDFSATPKVPSATAAKKLADTARTLDRFFAEFHGQLRHPASQIRPELFAALAELIADDDRMCLAADADCKASCAAAAASIIAARNAGGVVADTGYPLGEVPPARQGELTALEDSMLACSDLGELSTDLVAFDQFTLFDIASAITRHASGIHINQGDRPETTVGELFRNESARLAADQAQLDALLAKPSTLSLGQYTFEQEADEVAAEIDDLIGLAPYQGIPAILRLGAEREMLKGAPFPPVPSVEACTGFFDPSDTSWSGPEAIPLETISDPHHGYCYRAHNLFRVSQAHDYRERNGDLPDSGGPSWNRLRELAPALK